MNSSLKMIWAGLGLLVLIAFTYLVYRDIPVPITEIRKNIVIDGYFKKAS